MCQDACEQFGTAVSIVPHPKGGRTGAPAPALVVRGVKESIVRVVQAGVSSALSRIAPLVFFRYNRDYLLIRADKFFLQKWNKILVKLRENNRNNEKNLGVLSTRVATFAIERRQEGCVVAFFSGKSPSIRAA